MKKGARKYSVKVLNSDGAVVDRISAPGQHELHPEYVYFTSLEAAQLAATDALFDDRLRRGYRSDHDVGDWVEGITNCNPDDVFGGPGYSVWILLDRLTKLKYAVYARR